MFHLKAVTLGRPYSAFSLWRHEDKYTDAFHMLYFYKCHCVLYTLLLLLRVNSVSMEETELVKPAESDSATTQKQRVILIPVDHSTHAEKAFDCKSKFKSVLHY